MQKVTAGQLSLTIYHPKNATADNNVPVIVCAHGWNNSKEMQNHNFIELSKRGFVVVTVDLAGHGRTDVALLDESGWGSGNTEGVLAAIEYAMSLPYVDETQVSVVGHSAGDLALAYAIQQINVEGSKKHISSFYCPAGTMAAFLLTRNAGAISNMVLGVACGKYDELDTKYFGTFDNAGSWIQSNLYPDVVNGIVFYTLASGVFAFIMITVNFGVRKLLYWKEEKVESVMRVARVGSAARFIRTVEFAVITVLLMFIACVVSYFVFDVNFGISVYVVGVPRINWLPTIILKYIPIWLLFTVANGALVTTCRYKEVPDWVTGLFVTLANFLPIFILTMDNYATLISTGATKYTFGDPTIFAFNLFAPMIFITIVNRVLYKKTNNIWAAAIINSSVLAIMALTITRHISDIALML